MQSQLCALSKLHQLNQQESQQVKTKILRLFFNSLFRQTVLNVQTIFLKRIIQKSKLVITSKKTSSVQPLHTLDNVDKEASKSTLRLKKAN